MAYQTSVVSSTEEALSVGFGLGLHCRRRQESVHEQAQVVLLFYSCSLARCRILAIESLGNTLEVNCRPPASSTYLRSGMSAESRSAVCLRLTLQRCGFTVTGLGRVASYRRRLLLVESTSCRVDRTN